MPELALAVASSTDWLARGLAIGSLAVSITTVVVTVLLWRRDGWKVRVEADPLNYGATVTNDGRMPCTVQMISFELRYPGVDGSRYWFAEHMEKFPAALAPTDPVRTQAHPMLWPLPSKPVRWRVMANVGGRTYYSPWCKKTP